MVLVYLPNDMADAADNARRLASNRWPGQVIEMRNPARVNAKQGAETDGVVGVVLAGGPGERLRQIYDALGVPVMDVKLPKLQPRVGQHSSNVDPGSIYVALKATAAGICRLGEAKIVPLIGIVGDIGFLVMLLAAERSTTEPRAAVFAAAEARIKEFMPNEQA